MTDTNPAPKLSRSQQLLNRYKDEVKREKEEARELDRDQKILLGSAMIAAMKNEPEAVAVITAWVDKYTTKPNDRRRVAEWLPQQA